MGALVYLIIALHIQGCPIVLYTQEWPSSKFRGVLPGSAFKAAPCYLHSGVPPCSLNSGVPRIQIFMGVLSRSAFRGAPLFSLRARRGTPRFSSRPTQQPTFKGCVSYGSTHAPADKLSECETPHSENGELTSCTVAMQITITNIALHSLIDIYCRSSTAAGCWAAQ
jgi:hypothetical protein